MPFHRPAVAHQVSWSGPRPERQRSNLRIRKCFGLKGAFRTHKVTQRLLTPVARISLVVIVFDRKRQKTSQQVACRTCRPYETVVGDHFFQKVDKFDMRYFVSSRMSSHCVGIRKLFNARSATRRRSPRAMPQVLGMREGCRMLDAQGAVPARIRLCVRRCRSSQGLLRVQPTRSGQAKAIPHGSRQPTHLNSLQTT
jgi:hypothetical protein